MSVSKMVIETMTEKLKPCPFCGGEPQLVQGYGAYSFTWYVECHGEDCAVTPDTSGHGRDNAIARWNRRAPQEEGK